MIFTASDVSSLAVSLERWEWAEYASCALVALGCIGEYIAEFTDCWTSGLKDRKDRLAKRSTLLLISALALELMCLVKTNSISGMLIGSLSEKAGAADIKAQSALDKAGLAENKAGAALGKSKAAEEAVGKAQEKADAVAKEATRLRAQLIKQDLRAHLLQGNKRRGAFVKHIKGFSGQTFDIRYCPNPDNEILFLSMQLMATISAGKWQPKEIGKSLGCGTGIVIFLDPRASKSTESAAAALQIALFEAGLVRTPKTEFARSEGRPAAPGEDLLEPSSVDTILVVVQAHP